MPKISARKLILCELLHLNFKRKNNVRGKGYRCGKFLWKDTRKESFMFWLRNGNYLITSSSSSTLLLDILIFHSDASQSLFCLIICCWIYSALGSLFFQLQNGKKFSAQGKEMFLVGAFAQSWKFSCPRKNFWNGLQPSFFEKKKPSICTNKFTSRKP